MDVETGRTDAPVLWPTLTASLGPGQVRRACADDAIDGIEPSMVLTARSASDVETIINQARTAGLALIPCGGATKLALGNRPRAFDLRLSLTGLATITEQRSEDMTVTVQAGVTVAQLNRALAADGQRLAVDPTDPQRTTLGGIVATNCTGGLAHGYGTPRDLVLGMDVVDGRGRCLSVGGRVVKNVAGYDLVRLFTGSWGTLAVITEVTLRTHPLPERATTLSLRFDDALQLERARAALFASELPLAALDFAASSSPPGWELLLRIEGTDDEVAYQIERVRGLCGSADPQYDDEWNSPVHRSADCDLVLVTGARANGCVAAAERMLAAAGQEADSVTVAAHGGLGLVVLGAAAADSQQALAIVAVVSRGLGDDCGPITVRRCPVAAKSTLDVWGAKPAGFALMQAVKQRFDPHGLLSPGRFVGGL